MTTMHWLNEGDKIEVQGSGKKPYLIKKTGGVVSCSCPAWLNMGGPIDNRVCKHIKANVNPDCLLPQAQESFKPNEITTIKGVATGRGQSPNKISLVLPEGTNVKPGDILTKTGRVSTAVKPPVIKDTAPPVLLAHTWEGEDPTGWWMSEKLDGVRAWWDGEKFISRLGNIYHAPEWFKAAMPQGVVLDGELWGGRGKFQETVGAVKKLVANDEEWQKITFKVFDAPQVPGGFEERLQFIEELYTSDSDMDNDRWAPLKQWICGDKEHLHRLLEHVLSEGAEGLMLREPGSMYVEGRSKTLLKVKKFFDAEAMVFGHEPGRGKHKGRLGALVCVDNGKEFKVGSGFTDKERENPPKIGSVITYKYQELTKDGIPRFPVFIGVRDYE